MIIKTH